MSQVRKVELPENLTIANVQSLHEMFESVIDESDHDQIVIDGGNVQRADTAGVQLLQALVIAAKERQIILKWKNPSIKLTAAADTLGMKGTLGLI